MGVRKYIHREKSTEIKVLRKADGDSRNQIILSFKYGGFKGF